MRVLASASAVSNARATPRAVRRAPAVLATARSHPDARERTTAMPIAGVVAAVSVALASPALALGGVASPPRPPELNSGSNSYIQGLLAKTEANKELRKVEMENSNCLKQSRLGIGDCAGLPEEELRAAMELSKRRVAARLAAEAAGAAEAAADAVAAEVREQGDWAKSSSSKSPSGASLLEIN